jgi:transcriptional repressor NrdR
MLCPYCEKETKVLESRLIDNSVRRRRECLDCTNRFTTYEQAVFQLTVRKKNLKEQPFDSNKITTSLKRACRKSELNQITNLSKKIETKLLAKKKKTLTTKEIGKEVLKELKKFDKIAYVRFASIHKSIEDPKMLEKEVSMLT